MAKAGWVSTTPSSGSGNGSVTVSSNAEHTGRVARTSVITFKGGTETHSLLIGTLVNAFPMA